MALRPESSHLIDCARQESPDLRKLRILNLHSHLLSMSTESNDSLIGKRVCLRAIKQEGSARRLNGVTATVIGPHPITADWFRIELEENTITNEREWTIPADRLIVCDGDKQ